MKRDSPGSKASFSHPCHRKALTPDDGDNTFVDVNQNEDSEAWVDYKKGVIEASSVTIQCIAMLIRIFTVRYPPRATAFSFCPFTGAADFNLNIKGEDEVDFDGHCTMQKLKNWV